MHRQPYTRGDRCYKDCSEGGRTKMSMADECNINLIMARHKKTGLVSHVAAVQPEYGDFNNATDYQNACNAIIAADQAFESLPADVRKEMDNDPGQFLDFMADPDNEDRAIELGLLPPKPFVPKPTPEAAEPAPAPPPGAGEEA